MKITVLGVDLAKHVFQLHGVEERGHVFRHSPQSSPCADYPYQRIIGDVPLDDLLPKSLFEFLQPPIEP